MADSVAAIKKIIEFGRRLQPAVWMVAINAIIFVVLLLLAVVDGFIDPARPLPDIVVDNLMLSPSVADLIARPWTLFSYMFVQYEPAHLMINMLWLWLFASVLTSAAGPGRLWVIYVGGGAIGGAAYLLSAYLLPQGAGGGLVGASAAVLSVMGATMVLRPRVTFRLFVLGKTTLLTTGLIALAILIVVTPFHDYGPHAAHAGGLLFGLGLGFWLKFRGKKARPIIHTFMVGGESGNGPSRSDGQRVDQTEPDLDTLLDKIRHSGYGSLTATERERLFKISSTLKDKEQ